MDMLEKKLEFMAKIDSIGFRLVGFEVYAYDNYSLSLYRDFYKFINRNIKDNFEWDEYEYTDLKPILKISRRYKLKQLLKQK